MKKAKISLICALAENRAIGKNNSLLWNIPEDMQRFKKLTSGHTVVMGKRTYKSIGKPLPNRKNIVISKNKEKIKGCIVCNSIDEAISKAKEIENKEIFVIGGGSIYAQIIDLADILHLTLVEGKPDADTFFPDYKKFDKIIFEKLGISNNVRYKFIDLERSK